MIPLHKSTTYRRFVEDRNKALEAILRRHQEMLVEIVFELEALSISIVPKVVGKGWTAERIDALLHPAFKRAADMANHNLNRLQRLAFTLSYVGEAEAIARTTGEKITYSLTKEDLRGLDNPETMYGGTTEARLSLAFDRLRRKVLDGFQVAIVGGEDIADAMERIKSNFPRKRMITRPPRTLSTQAKLHEAEEFSEFDLGDGASLAIGFVDDDTWEDMVAEVRAGLPSRAGEEKVRGRFIGKRRITKQDWEAEQFYTDQFVSAVRDGQIDAARENGYTDFVWIAIVDDKTDECCLWRDGLLVSEIEKQLQTTHKDDRCKTSVVPAHARCRCDIAPVTDAILKFEPPQKLGDFETWLTAS